MKRNTACLFLFGSLLSISGMAQTKKDSIQAGRNYMIDEVVVTGTRNETDVRHLPMTISVVGRQQIEKRYEPSLLPLLTEQVPGLFTTRDRKSTRLNSSHTTVSRMPSSA